jgi:hypothetical protein
MSNTEDKKSEDKKSLEGADVLLDDHTEVGGLIHELLATLDVGDKSQIFARLDLLWARLAVHIRAEHLCLFPAILGAPVKPSNHSSTNAPSAVQVREALERLRADHDFFMVELARAVNAMRELVKGENDPSADQLLEIKRRVLAVSDRLQEHNQLEEEQVYLWPEMLLSAVERAELSARMKREIENLPPRLSSS